MTRYQALTASTAIATLVLIAIGAVVRTTGSGLGCPDWPLCHGELLPPLEKTAIIEYTHRTAAAVVGLLIVLVALVTFRWHRRDRTLTRLAAASLPLLALQAWFGKETVERELPAEVVAIHLAAALILLAILAIVAMLAYLGPERSRIEDADRRGFVRIATGATVVTFVVLILGAYVVGANATTACLSWPGCDQAPVPFFDGIRAQHIQWLHRITVLGGLAAVLLVAVSGAVTRGAGSTVVAATRLLVLLYVAQILIGASNIWTDFSEAARVAHLAAGSTILALLVTIVVGASYRPGLRAATRPAEERDQADAGAATARV